MVARKDRSPISAANTSEKACFHCQSPPPATCPYTLALSPSRGWGGLRTGSWGREGLGRGAHSACASTPPRFHCLRACQTGRRRPVRVHAGRHVTSAASSAAGRHETQCCILEASWRPASIDAGDKERERGQRDVRQDEGKRSGLGAWCKRERRGAVKRRGAIKRRGAASLPFVVSGVAPGRRAVPVVWRRQKTLSLSLRGQHLARQAKTQTDRQADRYTGVRNEQEQRRDSCDIREDSLRYPLSCESNVIHEQAWKEGDSAMRQNCS
jgi:hypothetical protein